MLADVACVDGNLVCYATGKQGVTIATTNGGGQLDACRPAAARRSR